MHALLMLGLMIVSELAFPQLIRQYGAGFMPWGEAERVARFNRAYGVIAFPRTLFLLLVCLPAAVSWVIPVDEDTEITTMLIFLAGWLVSVVCDLLRARAISMRD